MLETLRRESPYRLSTHSADRHAKSCSFGVMSPIGLVGVDVFADATASGSFFGSVFGGAVFDAPLLGSGFVVSFGLSPGLSGVNGFLVSITVGLLPPCFRRNDNAQACM